MKRRRVKLGLEGRSVGDTITYGRGIVQKMTVNPHFPLADNPHNALLETALNELEKADIEAADGGKTLTATLRLKRENVYNVIRPYRDFVNEKGNGDEEILNTTGFALAKLPSSTTDLGIPADVRTKILTKPGEVEVYCKKVDGATGYQIRHRPVQKLKDGAEAGLAEDEGWKVEDPLGPTRQTISGLQSAMYHEFQMRAIGAGPPSAWSGSVNGLAA